MLELEDEYEGRQRQYGVACDEHARLVKSYKTLEVDRRARGVLSKEVVSYATTSSHN